MVRKNNCGDEISAVGIDVDSIWPYVSMVTSEFVRFWTVGKRRVNVFERFLNQVQRTLPSKVMTDSSFVRNSD